MMLLKASNQWSTRPADERFKSLADLHSAVSNYRANAAEAERAYKSLKVQVVDGEPQLVGPAGKPAKFTHWAFGQLAARVEAPASYLRGLPPALAAQNLNHGLETLAEGDNPTAKLLFYANGTTLVQAFNTPVYARIWNSDITRRLIRLTQQAPEWQPAPEAFDGSRGLYASDHDLFTFMVDNERRIFERGPEGDLSRGFFCWNSEVGASSFGIAKFLYEFVCGNHRVWGVTGYTEFRIRHVGEANDRAFSALQGELRKYADSSTHEDEAAIERAHTVKLGGTKDEVLDKVFGLRIAGLGRKVIETAYDRAVAHDAWYGDPRSVWGFTGGLTEYARDEQYADARVALDRAANRVMQLVF